MPHITQAQWKEAVAVLKQGGVILCPTETAYGLVADATNKKATKRVRNLKERPEEKSFPLIVASLAMAKRYALFSPQLLILAKRYWPGPLTMVVPARSRLELSPDVISHGTIAIRVSSNPIARSLSRRLNAPVVGTSANHSGDPNSYTVEEALASLGKNVDDCLDGGRLRPRKPSTMIKEEQTGVTILRQGDLKIPKTYVAKSEKKFQSKLSQRQACSCQDY